MDVDVILQTGLGAILGVVLAEVVNFTRLAWNWWNRPILLIEPPNDRCLLLAHGSEVSTGQFYDEQIYGFSVRNAGRRIATGVRFQLTRIEFRDIDSPDFVEFSGNAYDLALYKGAYRPSSDYETVLVPNAAVVVALAKWREDHDPVFPSVNGLPAYYEEICTYAEEYRLTVVAFDEKAHFSQSVLTLGPPHKGGAT